MLRGEVNLRNHNQRFEPERANLSCPRQSQKREPSQRSIASYVEQSVVVAMRRLRHLAGQNNSLTGTMRRTERQAAQVSSYSSRHAHY